MAKMTSESAPKSIGIAPKSMEIWRLLTTVWVVKVNRKYEEFNVERKSCLKGIPQKKQAKSVQVEPLGKQVNCVQDELMNPGEEECQKEQKVSVDMGENECMCVSESRRKGA